MLSSWYKRTVRFSKYIYQGLIKKLEQLYISRGLYKIKDRFRTDLCRCYKKKKLSVLKKIDLWKIYRTQQYNKFMWTNAYHTLKYNACHTLRLSTSSAYQKIRFRNVQNIRKNVYLPRVGLERVGTFVIYNRSIWQRVGRYDFVFNYVDMYL